MNQIVNDVHQNEYENISVAIWAICYNDERRLSFVGRMTSAAERHKMSVDDLAKLLVRMVQLKQKRIRLPAAKAAKLECGYYANAYEIGLLLTSE